MQRQMMTRSSLLKIKEGKNVMISCALAPIYSIQKTTFEIYKRLKQVLKVTIHLQTTLSTTTWNCSKSSAFFLESLALLKFQRLDNHKNRIWNWPANYHICASWKILRYIKEKLLDEKYQISKFQSSELNLPKQCKLTLLFKHQKETLIASKSKFKKE